MKKIIPLFAFAITLTVPPPLSAAGAVFALSISSEKIDTFMHLPEWLPTSVDAEHTFGSDDRTNASHRVTDDTLAAVESVFDAYHERVFFASEGRSNDWDTAVYGPRPYELRELWFTNTLERSTNVFVYSTWTNEWPRATPDSRRLLEFDNLFGLAPWIPPLFTRRTGAPWLDKGDTWGRSRDIMFGSSWGPVDPDLPEVGWTDNASFRPDLAASCVPLCYCTTDTVFKVSPPPSTDGFLYDVLRGLDSHFNALYRIEGGPAPASVSTNGYLAEWHNSGAWTNSAAAKTSVPGVITNSFPLAGPEAGLTNLTRRLVPDDYVTPMVVTSYYENVKSVRFSIDLSRTRPNSTKRSLIRREHFRYSTISRYEFRGDRTVLVEFESEPSSYGTVDWISGSADVGLDVGPADRVSVRFDGEPRSGDWIIGHVYPSEEEICVWYWSNGPFVDLVVDYEKFVVKTGGLEKVSSLLATESRALAMLDRTYEIPELVVPSSIPQTATARDEERRFQSSLVARGARSVSVRLVCPHVSFPAPIWLSDLVSGVQPEVSYSTTSVYSSVSHPTVVERRFRGGAVGASGGLTFTFQDGLPAVPYTVYNLKAFLADTYGRTFPGGNAAVYGIYPVDYNGSGVYVCVSSDFGSDVIDYLFWVPVSDLLPDSPVSVSVGGSVSVSRSATAFVGGVPGLQTFDMMYPSYGPGAFGFAEGRVGSSRALYAEEVLAFVSKMSGGLPAAEWSTDPIGLPLVSSRAEIDARPFTWSSWHRLAVSQPSGGVGSGLYAKAYDETYNALRAKVDAEFRSRVGDYSGAQSVIPVSLDMADFDDVVMTGLDVTLDGGHPFSGQLRFTLFGTLPSDAVVWDDTGYLEDDHVLLYVTPAVSSTGSGTVVPVRSAAKPAVAVDGRLSPVVVTDWNWNALISN